MLQILGYADRMSVAPGETIRLMVSAPDGRPYRAGIVRLIHGDANPEGPGFKALAVPSAIDGDHPGRRQTIAMGSWARVPWHPIMDRGSGVTLAAMIWPTTPGKGRQGLIGRWDEATQAGLSLEIDERRLPGARLGGTRISSGRRLLARRWYLVALSFDAERAEALLVQRPLQRFAGIDDAAVIVMTSPTPAIAGLDVTLASHRPRPFLQRQDRTAAMAGWADGARPAGGPVPDAVAGRPGLPPRRRLGFRPRDARHADRRCRPERTRWRAGQPAGAGDEGLALGRQRAVLVAQAGALRRHPFPR